MERKGLSQKIQEASAVFGPLSGVFGFIGDVITPLVPVLPILTATLAGVCLVIGIAYGVKKRRVKETEVPRFLPQMIILTIVFLIFTIMGFGNKRGFMGEHVEFIAQLQAAVFKLEEAAGLEEEEDEAPNIVINNTPAPSTLIDAHYGELQKRILAGAYTDVPKSVEDVLVNAMVYSNIGNLKQADSSFVKLFNEGYIRYDLTYKFYETLFTRFEGNEDSIRMRIAAAGLTDNEMMRLATVDFHFNGVSYYAQVDQIKLSNPELRAFAENLKARSLCNDADRFGLYRNYIIGYWAPVWDNNAEKLDRRIIKTRKHFFDYSKMLDRYQAESGLMGFACSNCNLDEITSAQSKELRKHAPMLWSRIAGSNGLKSPESNRYTVSGRVVDEEGNPMRDILITDFDTQVDLLDEFNMSSTDEEGKFTLVTSKGNMLQLKAIFTEREFLDQFQVAVKNDLGDLVLKSRKPKVPIASN